MTQDHNEEAEAIKNKFIESMEWGEPGTYDQEDVKTIVLGNLNSMTYLFADALIRRDERIRELEGSKAVLLTDYQAAINSRDSVTQDRNFLIQKTASLESEIERLKKEMVTEISNYASETQMCRETSAARGSIILELESKLKLAVEALEYFSDHYIIEKIDRDVADKALEQIRGGQDAGN